MRIIGDIFGTHQKADNKCIRILESGDTYEQNMNMYITCYSFVFSYFLLFILFTQVYLISSQEYIFFCHFGELHYVAIFMNVFRVYFFSSYFISLIKFVLLSCDLQIFSSSFQNSNVICLLCCCCYVSIFFFFHFLLLFCVIGFFSRIFC